MDLEIEHVDVWVAPIPDRPGALASVLKSLARAGGDYQLVIARRSPDKPGTGVVFVTPLQGEQEIRAARELGFNTAQSMHSVRVRCQDRPGITASLAAALGEAGINLRSLSGSVIGSQVVVYFALDSKADAERAIDVLSRL